MKNVLLAALLASSVVVVVTDARATPEDDVAEATQRMTEARALYDAKRYEEARKKTMQACVVMRTPKCLIGLALAEYQTGHYLDAYVHGREALDSPKLPSIPERTTKALQEALDASYAKIGHVVLEVSADSKIPKTEADYLVSVDGKGFTYHAPEQLHVEVGRHTFQARDQGHAVQREVDAVAGQVVTVSLRDPVAPLPMPAAPLVVPAPDLVTHDEPAPSSSAHVFVPLALAGAGVVALVGGGMLGASSSSAYDDVKSVMRCTNAACADAAQSRGDDAHRSAVWSTILYGTGAALVVGAGVTWWLTKPTPTSTGTRATLLPGPASVRFTLHY